MDKETVIYIYIYIYIVTLFSKNKNKSEEILPFAAMSLYLEDIMLSEISQTEKDKFSMISFKCGMQKEQNTTPIKIDQICCYQRQMLGEQKLE